MELFYQVKQGDESTDLKRPLEGNKPVCSVSVRNLVAFTSCFDLSTKNTSSSKSKPKYSLDAISWTGSYVFVADLNTPWNCHLVKRSEFSVSHLHWDPSGVQILIGSEDGQVEVYGMVEELLNKWSVLYSGEFCGEPIVASSWLSAPRHVSLIPDKLDSILYSEKYEVKAIRRGRGFTNSLQGSIVVTGTGLLGAVIRSPQDPMSAITAAEKMIPLRSQILYADMAYGEGNEIVVACSSDKVNHPIKVSRVKVSLVGSSRDKAEIVVLAGHSLFLPNIPDYSISSVKFLSKIKTQSILVALKSTDPSSSTSHLYLYEIVSQSPQLKARFITPGVEPPPVFAWHQTQSISFQSPIDVFCSLGIPITSSSPSSSASVSLQASPPMTQQISNTVQPLVAVSLANGNLHFLRTDNFQQVGQMTVEKGQVDPLLSIKRDPDDIPEAKQMKLQALQGQGQSSPAQSTPFVSMEFTWSGSLLLAMDSKSQLYLYKIHPNIDATTATAFIELSMMGGLDPWDILMCLRPSLIESVSDRLSETFARQPPAVQGHCATRMLVIKAALHRLASGGVTRTNDQQTLLTLHLVSGALKALLRPRNLSSHDRGPAESLSNLLGSKGEALHDVDKVLLNMEAKEYAVEPTLLQSLQQFLQWCADLSVKLLAILPDLRHSRAPGWEVCRDSKAVGTLRELIVLMRIWGLIRPACLPSFRKTTENLDVLPLLFRLLTKLSVTPHDPDESLIDRAFDRPYTPHLDQIVIEKDGTAYTWLYISLGFAALVFLLLVIGFFWNNRKSKRFAEDESHSRMPTAFMEDRDTDTCRESSFFDGHSIVLSQIQPKNDMGYDRVDYPHVNRYPQTAGHGMTFGCYKQQPPQPQTLHLQMQNEALIETLEGKRHAAGVVHVHEPELAPPVGPPQLTKRDSLMYVPGRHASLDAYYVMDPEEKTPFQKQMEDTHEFRSYLHLTTELSRGDSLEEDVDAGAGHDLRTLPLHEANGSDRPRADGSPQTPKVQPPDAQNNARGSGQ